MINIGNKVLPSLFSMLLPSLAFGQLVPMSEAKVLSQNAFIEETRKSPELRFELFKGQSFVDKKTGMTISAGWASKSQSDERMECFLFVAEKSGPAAILFASARAETTWECIGSPALMAKASKFVQKDGLIVAALFEFQAPGGEIFKLPLAIEVVSGQRIAFGHLQECIEKKTSRTPLTRLRELNGIIKKCGN